MHNKITTHEFYSLLIFLTRYECSFIVRRSENNPTYVYLLVDNLQPASKYLQDFIAANPHLTYKDCYIGLLDAYCLQLPKDNWYW